VEKIQLGSPVRKWHDDNKQHHTEMDYGGVNRNELLRVQTNVKLERDGDKRLSSIQGIC
jgi:hypothetical protein